MYLTQLFDIRPSYKSTTGTEKEQPEEFLSMHNVAKACAISTRDGGDGAFTGGLLTRKPAMSSRTSNPV
jgi:hypothetical protein